MLHRIECYCLDYRAKEFRIYSIDLDLLDIFDLESNLFILYKHPWTLTIL